MSPKTRETLTSVVVFLAAYVVLQTTLFWFFFALGSLWP